jgi:hypothetical protein
MNRSGSIHLAMAIPPGTLPRLALPEPDKNCRLHIVYLVLP